MTDQTLVLQDATEEYERKQGEGKSGKEMFALAWDVKQLSYLTKLGRELSVECATLVDKLLDPKYDIITNNLANQIRRFREKVLSFVTAITKYRREPATHILVVLISPEERNKQPYALAVQCIGYKSIIYSHYSIIYSHYTQIVGGKHGIIEAEVVNRAVPTSVLKEILTWKEEGCTLDDVITRLRIRTVLSGYDYHTWSEGKIKQCIDCSKP